VTKLILKQSLFQRLKNVIKYKLFLMISQKSLPIFTRGSDSISINPIISGTYEPHLAAFIRQSATEYGDFFIDVGANIGLIACQSAQNYRAVHLIEPNPITSLVLHANALLSLKAGYTIHEFGLGISDCNLELVVPHKNFGGAFVSQHNPIPREIEEVSQSSLFTVEIKNASDFFRVLFNSFPPASSGVIKIDVEGYENIIIEAILSTLPSAFRCLICFENWRSNNELVTSNKYRIFRFAGEMMETRPLLSRLFFRMLNGWNFYLQPIGEESEIGNLIMMVEQK
jgi:FkbM family methyltransferase